ncbi:MAG: hypothetical protein D6710_06950 [Nitrospirae bacterium]|nr:MAG: hypothetical protein D6710_06950 [Nitrospirota bacterium]
MEGRYKGLALSVIGLLLFGLLSCQGRAPEINCRINQQECQSDFRGGVVYLDINPKPVLPMKELLFRVRLSGVDYDASTLEVYLTMPGMTMGENRVTLRRVGRDTYEGKGVFVRCPSGKTLWQAEVVMRGLGSVFYRFNIMP